MRARSGWHVLARGVLGTFLDGLRFAVDRRPTPYQPLPWIGIRGTRAQAVHTRWERILPLCEELGVTSAVDVGCNVGYFPICFALAGTPAVGIDSSRRNLRLMERAVERAGVADIGIMHMRVSLLTVPFVPPADAVLFLSVWHHLVRRWGLESATQIVSTLWERTGRILVFETGQSEMKSDYGLPGMEPSPMEWLESYLSNTCPGGEVRHLGRHQRSHTAGMKPNDSSTSAERDLWAVVRVSNGPLP